MTSNAFPLGRQVDYPRRYDPALLFPLARSLGRREIGINGDVLPFIGFDRWHAYELGWLDTAGKPCVATATLQMPADAPNLVESKSLKLYLNSFNAARFDSAEAVRAQIARDLSKVAQGPVTVAFGLPPLEGDLAGEGAAARTLSLDSMEITLDHYGPPRADFIQSDPGDRVVESLGSALLKSNCPVTGQPDWASVVISYRGPRIERAGLLRYLVSFRDHAEFHEQCVERIFIDLMARAQPETLSVEARYTRRGGLDINPWRATPGHPPLRAGRDLRQ